MTFFQALRLYILLLVAGALALVVIMPSQIRLDFGKQNLCRVTRLSYDSVCRRLPIPEKIPVTIPRPGISLTRFGINFERSLDFRYGLDVSGGTEVVLVADMEKIAESDRRRALESAREVIAKRVDLYGLSESTVETAMANNSYRLIASIPGITQSATVMSLIGSTAQLDFREYLPSVATASALQAGKPASGSATASPSAMLVTDFVPTDLTGKDLTRSSVSIEPTLNRPVISLEFSPEGTKKFAAITRRNIGKPLAIFLDEYPISAPNVENEITDGRAQISGEFSLKDAQSLAATLNAGSLPVPISVLSQRTLGATLGAESVTRSVRAGLIGVLLVICFLIALYGLKGVIASMSLLYYGLITLALYKLIPITISLPGIAGFLLSIGMAVDTIILVFERLREEEQVSEDTRVVLARAFSRAWGSIKDANIVTLISAFILANPLDWTFLNTSGMVRGFALTLALGIVLNLFTGMFVLRVFMRLFYSKK